MDKGVIRVPYPILGILVGVLTQIVMLAVLWGSTQSNIRNLQEQRREDNARAERYWQQQDKRFETLEQLIRDLYSINP